MTKLQGLEIALTRSAEDNEVWADQLRERGLVGLQIPCLVTETMPEQAEALRKALAGCEALLFSSPRAVHALQELAPELSLADKFCACVGEASAQAASRAGAEVRFLAPDQTARSLAEEWIARQPAEVATLWPRALQARNDLLEVFAQAGRILVAVPVYRTLACSVIDVAPAAEADAIFFASPSAAHAMSAVASIPAGPRLISIGPSTTAALEELGCTVSGQAQQRTLQGLLEALEATLQSESLPQ